MKLDPSQRQLEPHTAVALGKVATQIGTGVVGIEWRDDARAA